MNASNLLAKITWHDPIGGNHKELRLGEDAIVMIGRTPDNDVQINQEHVSRYHARIWHQHGFFVIQDLDSSNGVFINNQQISEPYPLVSGDVIRLYSPILHFEAIQQSSKPIPTYCLLVKNGVQAGLRIPLLLEEMQIGRLVANADWEIVVDDASVSRPHATFRCVHDQWYIHDLGSAYGTYVNDVHVNETDTTIQHGDIIQLGNLMLEFRRD